MWYIKSRKENLMTLTSLGVFVIASLLFGALILANHLVHTNPTLFSDQEQ